MSADKKGGSQNHTFLNTYSFDKCILQFGQIHFTILKDTVYNLDKYMQYGQIHFQVYEWYGMGADKKLRTIHSSMLHSSDEGYDGGDCGFCTGQFDGDTVVWFRQIHSTN